MIFVQKRYALLSTQFFALPQQNPFKTIPQYCSQYTTIRRSPLIIHEDAVLFREFLYAGTFTFAASRFDNTRAKKCAVLS